MKECFEKNVDKRLSIIEGHLRGIRKMVQEGKDCEDILIQLYAVSSSIDKVSKIILNNHINHCVKDAVEKGDLSVIDKLADVLDKYK